MPSNPKSALPQGTAITGGPREEAATGRVLVLAKGYPPDIGGVEQYSAEIASRLPRCGFRPIVVTQHSGSSGVRHRDGAVVINVGSGSQAIVLCKMLATLRRLARRQKDFRFALATTWRVAVPLLLLRLPLKIGVTIHGREILMPSGAIARLMRWVFRRVDTVFAVSDFTLREARGRGLLERAAALRNWNGLAEREQPIPNPALEQQISGDVRLLSLCRLIERKNIQAAIEAFAQFQQRQPQLSSNVKYIIAGDGPQLGHLRELAQRLCRPGSVVCLGRVSDRDKTLLYSKADVFLHPHISLNGGRDVEGFGLVIAEAMDWGLAVIAGKDGGASDFVNGGETGLIVDGRDTQALSQCIEQLVTDPQLRCALGKRAQGWVAQHLSWDDHVRVITAAMLGPAPAPHHAAEGV